MEISNDQSTFPKIFVYRKINVEAGQKMLMGYGKDAVKKCKSEAMTAIVVAVPLTC